MAASREPKPKKVMGISEISMAKGANIKSDFKGISRPKALKIKK